MVHTVVDRGTTVAGSSLRDFTVKAYQGMLQARVLDDKLASLYRAGKIQGGVFLGRGQEALSVAVGLHLRQGDIFAPLIRDLAGHLAFGETVLDAVRSFLGSPLGPMRARDGNVHRGSPRAGRLAMISHLGAMVSVVNGVLVAHRFKKIQGTVGVASIGDGGMATGSLHEGINQAAVEKLPLVLIVANNQYAYSTPNDREFACRSLVDRAIGYGVQGHSLDGNDLQACLQVVGEAVSNARAGRGPQMVVARLMRLCGHGEHDDASYLDAKLKAASFGRDCLKVAEDQLLEQHWADAESLASWRTQAIQNVETAVATVQREPLPNPYEEVWHALSSSHLIEGHHEP